jgi:hypothetical protein
MFQRFPGNEATRNSKCVMAMRVCAALLSRFVRRPKSPKSVPFTEFCRPGSDLRVPHHHDQFYQHQDIITGMIGLWDRLYASGLFKVAWLTMR